MSAADPGDPAALPGGAAGAGDAAGAGAPPAQRAASSQPAFSRSASAQPPPGPAPDPASPTSDAASVSATATATASVNADNPWLGLASFTEETRAFFFGREQEITELERRVQRKLLTVLFGKSGLGKTSILQAGLVPGLRARGYFPVYLRIDYGHDSPEASEQIKQAINRAAAGREAADRAAAQGTTAEGTAAEGTAAEEGAAQGAGQGPAAEGAAQGSNGQVAAGQGAVGQGRLGHGAAAPAIDPEESIWEFLHHREGAQDSGAVLRDIGVVPQDVSAETRTVKSAATPPAPTAQLGATARPIATAPPRPVAPATPIPLLIFDQFEELFTLAQSDEFGRARAARFVEELADLVENRPPKALEAKLDSDDSLSERFDFSRSDYRVVISLREDYLAPLESLKKQMPSLSQNRLRLAPMTGDQALEAVLLPGQRLAEDSVLPGRRRGAGAAQWSGRPLEAGGQLGAGAAGPPGAGTPLEPEAAQVPGRPPGAGRALVSQEVAEAIVRFVAGGAELANAEVEPSLLSLICRELNEQRLAQHHSEISLGLLAGSRESILGSFYERALADQPPAVRSLIEDELLTESGYRENLAEESLLRKLQTAGAAPDALAKLVNRRLLRIEERLDVRRVELTHDVLTGVVKASRDQRHEREARAATERLLAEQAARESAARRALRRARAIAAGCTALATAAVIAALFAVINVRRARLAEADARQTRIISEQARRQAEGLLGFLTDDFVRELQTFGRYQTIADLSQREIDYFKALPPQLKDPQSIRNGALAYINQARALSFIGDPDAQTRSAAQAVALLEPLRRGGDRSEATAVVLARAYVASPTTEAVAKDAAASMALLRPIAERPGAPAGTVRGYVEVLTDIAKADWEHRRYPDAVAVASEAVRLIAPLRQGENGRDDVTLDADYTDAAQWLVGGLEPLGRNEEARRDGEDVLRVADRVLVQRPQFGQVLSAEAVTETELSEVAESDLEPAEALRLDALNERAGTTLVALEPRNAWYGNALGVGELDTGIDLWAAGRLHESIDSLRRSIQAFDRSIAGGDVPFSNFVETTVIVVYHEAQLADWTAAAATLTEIDGFISRLPPGDSVAGAFAGAMRSAAAAELAYARGDFGAAQRGARAALARVRTARFPDALYTLSHVEGRSEYALGDFGAAERSERTALQAGKTGESERRGDWQRGAAQVSTWLAMALAGEGKRAEAAATIGPVVTMYRALAARNHGDEWLPLEFAEALYAQSLTDAAHRPALLREAAGLIEHLTPAIAALHDTRAWRARIEAGGR